MKRFLSWFVCWTVLAALSGLATATNLPPLSSSIGVWGDYDNDGLMDGLLAGTIQGVPGISDGRFTRIYHNEGGGSFQELAAALPQLDNAAAAWGDFDKDGDLDLLLSGMADGTTGPVSVTEVYRNDGSNQFTPLIAGLEGRGQGSVSWVDYDNDGDVDIFVTGLNTATTNWATQPYRNNGNSTFTHQPASLPGLTNGFGHWGDYDNDGDADLLLRGSDATYLLKNDGEGVFTNSSLSIPAQHRVISPWGDFDGDGDLDFMTSSGVLPSVFGGPDYHPSFSRNDNAAFSSSFDYSLDMWLFSANWGDIDNSGRSCVVVSGWMPLLPGGGVWGSATKVYINLGSSWQEVFTLGGWDNRTETWVDLDGDGDLDIFTTGGQLTTFWTNNVALHRDFPQPPLNLAANFTALDAVTLSWQTPSNTPPTGRGLSYNLRVGRTPGGVDVVSPMADAATGRRLIQTLGNAGTARLVKLNNLPPGNYYWSMQSIGQSFTGSPFAVEGTFTVTSSPPVILTQPVDQTIFAGSNATFFVSVIGTKPLSYQWRNAGVPLTNDAVFTGTANSNLTTLNTQPAYAGLYDVVITNDYGAITSAAITLQVQGEPRILVQPADQNVLSNRTATFKVVASGGLPLSYRWLHYGIPLLDDDQTSGTTTATLTIQNVHSGYAGVYSVIVSNAWGSITSSVVTLNLAVFRYVNVNNPTPSSPYLTWATAATVIQDAINVAAIGDEILVTNGVYSTGGLIGPGDHGTRVSVNKPIAVKSVNGPLATAIIGHVQPYIGAFGNRCAYVTNGAVLDGFTLTQGRVESGPDKLGNKAGGGVYCQPGGVVPPVVSNCIITGNRAGYYGGGGFWGTYVNCLFVGNSSDSGAGAYAASLLNCTVVKNSAEWGGGTYTCNVTNSIVWGNSASVAVTYSNWINTSMYYSSTAPSPGGANNSTSDPLLMDLAGGNFRLQSASPCLNAGSSLFVTATIDLDGNPRVVDGIVDMGAYEYQHAPWIVLLPASQSAVVFSNVTFTALALGDEPLAYQWQRNGLDLFDDGRITGTATPSLAISMLNVEDATGYRVVVTNAHGSVTSVSASLTVLGPPLISIQPASRNVSAGTNVSFSVAASGLVEIFHQWRFNQTDLSGKTNDSLSLTNVQSANAGNYDVVITNLYGALTSSPAILTVLPAAPTITTQPVSRVVSVGQNTFFSVTAKGTEPMTCQWQFNGADLFGANAFTLTLTNVNSSFAGTYCAAVSNDAGFAFSTNVTLVASPVLVWPTNNQQVSGNITIPASVTNVIAIAAGKVTDYGRPCFALRADGMLVAWGGFTSIPANTTNAVAISAHGLSVRGENNLALIGDGTVVHWSTVKQTVPAAITNGNLVAVAAGASHQLALRGDGTVFAWGSGGSVQTNVPASATNVIAIAAGTDQSLALRADGTVVVWGAKAGDQAAAFSNVLNVAAISAGGNQALGLLGSGSVFGYVVTNNGPQLNFYGPPPPDATNLTAISAGLNHSLALRADGTVLGWGNTNFGKTIIPVIATNVVAIAAGSYHSLALVHDPFAPPIPPRIARSPLSRTVMTGQGFVLNALAIGGLPLSYQWHRNGEPLAGKTNQWLSVESALPGDAGDYLLIAANDVGSVTSAVAVVSVSIPQPVLQSLGMGGNGFSFAFESVTGVLYISELRDTVVSGPWIEMERRFGIGGLETVTDSSAGAAIRFYRVRVE